ncbi:MAG TPA: SGNH/GDSL hydrolase family protein [Opitutaceae bacterium]
MKFRSFAIRVSSPVGLAAAVAAASALLTAFLPSAAAGIQNPYQAGAPSEFSAVYVFGDSLSDTGRLFAATGIPPAPFYFNGRTSNGPLWPEYFSPAVGLAYAPLDNFAWVGANTGRTNVWETPLRIDLPGMLDEVDEYVAGLGWRRRADRDALYVVFGGSNDFFRILSEGADPARIIPQAVLNLAKIVLRLQLLGAKHIVVINLPDLGLTPRVRASGPGPAAAITGLCVVFNVLLDGVLDWMPRDVVRVDAFSSLNAWFAAPGLFGFTNVTDPGLLSGTNGDTYLFWDDIHPTTRAHALLAETVLEAFDEAWVQASRR